MRNLLALLGFVIVVFAVVGYSRGWYSFDVSTGSDGKVKVHGDIDTGKIKDDGSAGLEKIGNGIESFKTKSSSQTNSAPATLPVGK